MRTARLLSPECQRALQGDPDEKLTVDFYFNGGFPRTHSVSRGFLQRLEVFLRKHPRADVVWSAHPARGD